MIFTRRAACSSLFALAALLPAGAYAQPAQKLQVVASFSILADLVRNIGGEAVAVTALAGPNTDVHVFQPTPADARTVSGANLVVLNGLGFEGWSDRLVKASGYKGPVVIAARGVKAMQADDNHDHAHGKGHDHGPSDPHAWQDIGNAKLYVANIRDALIAADPERKADYGSRAARYLAELDALDAEIKAAIAAVPPERRRIITSHDAFRYFGSAYGVTFLAPQGATGDSEPSAKDVARLIRQIKREKVKAVFVENISNPRVITQIAKDAGVTLGGTLYSDALSDASGPAPTYIALMRHNAQQFVEAMK